MYVMLLRGLCNALRADRYFFLARCPKGVRRVQTFTFSGRYRARYVRGVTNVVLLFHGPIRRGFLLSFGTRVVGTDRRFYRLNRTLDEVFLPTFFRYLFIVFHEYGGRGTTGVPWLAGGACAIFRRACRDRRLFGEDFRAVLFRSEGGRSNCFLVKFLLGVLVIRPSTFFVIGFDAQLATAVRVGGPS